MNLAQRNINVQGRWPVKRHLTDVFHDADNFDGARTLVIVVDQETAAKRSLIQEPPGKRRTHECNRRCVRSVCLREGSSVEQASPDCGEIAGRDDTQIHAWHIAFVLSFALDFERHGPEYS